MREIIFDTETTGLSPENGDRIIEIGAIELVNRFPTGNTFHEYLHPGDQEIHPDAERIHGISMAQLEGKPSFADILPKFLAFFETGTLIAHNAKFDVGFFDAELRRVNQAPIDVTRVVDTLAIAKRKFPGARNSLDALCDRFGISRASRTLHGALLDSELLADVYELMDARSTANNREIVHHHVAMLNYRHTGDHLGRPGAALEANERAVAALLALITAEPIVLAAPALPTALNALALAFETSSDSEAAAKAMVLTTCFSSRSQARNHHWTRDGWLHVIVFTAMNFIGLIEFMRI